MIHIPKHVCAYVYIYIHTHVCIHVHLYIHAYTHIHMHTHAHIRTCISISPDLHECECQSTHIYICTCIYIYSIYSYICLNLCICIYMLCGRCQMSFAIRCMMGASLGKLAVFGFAALVTYSLHGAGGQNIQHARTLVPHVRMLEGLHCSCTSPDMAEVGLP